MTQHSYEECLRQYKQARSALEAAQRRVREAEARLDEALLRTHGVVMRETLVRDEDERGRVGRVVAVSKRWERGRPWVNIELRRKDGTFGRVVLATVWSVVQEGDDDA